MNSDYEQNQQGLLFFVLYGPNMSSNIIKLYMDGFFTQRSFHRVQEQSKMEFERRNYDHQKLKKF